MTNSNSWRDVQGNPSNPEAHPFRVTIVYSDSRPGMNGWSSRSQVFATLDEALLVASLPCGKGVTKVCVDLAKNRATWSDNGYWESVGTRQPRQVFRWGKNWSHSRAAEVRAYFEKHV